MNSEKIYNQYKTKYQNLSQKGGLILGRLSGDRKIYISIGEQVETFTFVRYLFDSANSRVYLLKQDRDGKLVVFKQPANRRVSRSTVFECSFLAKLRKKIEGSSLQKNILEFVTCKQVDVDGTNIPGIVSNYTGNSLQHTNFTNTNAFDLFMVLCRTIQGLNNNYVMHGDLKSLNICCDTDAYSAAALAPALAPASNLTIIDFGSATHIEDLLNLQFSEILSAFSHYGTPENMFPFRYLGDGGMLSVFSGSRKKLCLLRDLWGLITLQFRLLSGGGFAIDGMYSKYSFANFWQLFTEALDRNFTGAAPNSFEQLVGRITDIPKRTFFIKLLEVFRNFVSSPEESFMRLLDASDIPRDQLFTKPADPQQTILPDPEVGAALDPIKMHGLVDTAHFGTVVGSVPAAHETGNAKLTREDDAFGGSSFATSLAKHVESNSV